MRFQLQRLLGVLLLGACSTEWAASPPAGDAPPVPWPTVEEVQFAGAPQDTAQLLEWLLSADRASSTEAQIRLLARVDDPLLTQLESLAAQHPQETERERVREFLRVLTTRWRHVGELARFPTLTALVSEDVARGLRLVASWKDVNSTEGIRPAVWAPLPFCGDDPPVTPEEPIIVRGAALESLSTALQPLGGLALPAIERWLSSPSAPERLRGMALANRLGVRPQQQLLQRLRADPTQVELAWTLPTESPPTRGQSHRARRSIAELTKGLQANLDYSPLPLHLEKVRSGIKQRSAPWFRIAGRVDPIHSSAFSEPAWSAGGVQDEQEYWNLMRPRWRDWWDRELLEEHSLDATPDPALDDAWTNRTLRLLGYQLAESRYAVDTTFLRLEGPAGAEVEVIYLPPGRGTPVVRPVVLPSRQMGIPPTRRFKVRVRTGQDWMEFDPGISLFEGHTATVWLEPGLRRAYLETMRQRTAAK